MSLAEKFQITIPAKPEDGHDWVDFKGQRVTHACKDNEMPIGYDASGGLDMLLSPAGTTDVSNTINDELLRTGFKRREMKSTDDQYSGEHCDLFYGEAVDEEGKHGFVERNNYMDRM